MSLLESILYFGSGFAFLAFAVAALLFLAWSLIGRPGDERRRRLRLALSCAILFLAAFVATAALLNLVLWPVAMHPWSDIEKPYAQLSLLLSTAVPLLLYTSAAFLIRAIYRAPDRKWSVLLSAVCLLAAWPVYAAGYMLVYRVQVPAMERYVVIENHEWKTQVGEAAPDISIVMLDGAERRLSDFRGKVVVLNFFATWCGPCQFELPHLQEMWDRFKTADRFTMLVVSRAETEDTVREFISKQVFTFPVALDREGTAFGEFAKEGIPRTYLIGPDGIVLLQTVGFGDRPLYERELATLQRMIEEQLVESQ